MTTPETTPRPELPPADSPAAMDDRTPSAPETPQENEQPAEDAPKETLGDYACGFLHWNDPLHACAAACRYRQWVPGGMTGVWLVLQEYSENCGKYTTAGVRT
eukprot:gene13542-biopygen76